MIEIKKKKDCCGCSACAEICPKCCIRMQEDEEGFLYPAVDTSICVNCGLCEKVCPVLNQSDEKRPIKVYAAINTDEDIREKSSSGGVFSMLAQKTIEDGGLVFGAKFNKNWDVVHGVSETLDGLSDFRGSKYVQSDIGISFSEAEAFLKKGRKVLFSGTACQIAGLKKFLQMDYENLLTVDVVCHGAPSSKVWREYMRSIEPDTRKIRRVSFRDKSTGWKDYCFSVKTDNSEITQKAFDNPYMRGFLGNIYLRPSCYACPAKAGKSESDITLGDFWGISGYHPEMDDDKGTSLVMLNTAKGLKYFSLLRYNNICETTFEEAVAGNPSILHSVAIPAQRDRFFRELRRSDDQIKEIIDNTLNRMRQTFWRRCIFNTKKYLKHI